MSFGIDTQSPTITIISPVDNGSYGLNSTVLANFVCADAGSGPQSCTGTVASGQPISTTPLGATKTFTVTATDAVGHSVSTTVHYKVALRDIVFARGGDIYTTSSEPGTGDAPITLGSPTDAEPEWTPNGQKVVFSSNRAGNDDIYIMNADGTGVTRLTSDPASDRSPTVSPDGTRIAFASNRNANWDIYVMNINGSNVQRITTNGNDDLLPTWAPNSSDIAYYSARSGQGDIYRTVATPGGKETRLTSGTGGNSLDTEPAWSPDGNTIAFTSYRDGQAEIYTMDPNGNSLVRRTTTTGSNEVTPAWSTDSTTLVYARTAVGGTNSDIYKLKLSPVTTTALVTNAAADITPDW